MWLDSSHLRHQQQCIKYLLKYFGPSNGLFDKLFFPGIKLSTITRVEGVWVFLTILDLKTNYSKMLFRLSEAWPFCRKGHLSEPFKMHQYERILRYTIAKAETAQWKGSSTNSVSTVQPRQGCGSGLNRDSTSKMRMDNTGDKDCSTFGSTPYGTL